MDQEQTYLPSSTASTVSSLYNIVNVFNLNYVSFMYRINELGILYSIHAMFSIYPCIDSTCTVARYRFGKNYTEDCIQRYFGGD